MGVCLKKYVLPGIVVFLAMMNSSKVLAHSESDLKTHQGLHFTHPLIGESPSPDTKVRFDYMYSDSGGDVEGTKNTLRFEGEYAFNRVFAVELDAPFTFLDQSGQDVKSNPGDIEIGFKFANFAFENKGILLGYGIELGLPTGDEDKGIGNSRGVSLGPFLSAGYKLDDLEITSFAVFASSVDRIDDSETELEYNLSLIYVAGHVFEPVLEFDGSTVLNGGEEGRSVLNLSPGLRVRPFKDREVVLGAAVSFPVSNSEEFNVRTIGSVFYHF